MRQQCIGRLGAMLTALIILCSSGGLAMMRNTVEGGHRLRWKADTRMVIADT